MSTPTQLPPLEAGERSKDLFRHLDELTEQVFRRVDGPGVFDELAVELACVLGDDLRITGVRAEAPRAGVEACRLGARDAEIRLEAFGRLVVLSFELGRGADAVRVELLLHTLRSILAVRLVERTFGDTMRQATEIQQSLLPRRVPDFAEYEIAVRCVPTDEVGGDFYDFLELDEETLGLAVGDASGHGLPAALLVRDVVVGLRMGMEKDLKPAHALRKLNRVIHTSALSSCFVSLLYAELEPNGNLFYYNAGHEPPLLARPGAPIERLASPGTVIGPLADANFKRRYAHLDRGALLAIYTDGLIERRDPLGRWFGVERLEAALTELAHLPCERIVAEVFARVGDFHPGQSWDDDATLLLVRRRA